MHMTHYKLKNRKAGKQRDLQTKVLKRSLFKQTAVGIEAVHETAHPFDKSRVASTYLLSKIVQKGFEILPAQVSNHARKGSFSALEKLLV